MARDAHSQEFLEQQIREGGSVLHEGKLIRTIEDLRRAFDTAESIEEQMKDLEARRSEIAAKQKELKTKK
jgi:hypothetical protein